MDSQQIRDAIEDFAGHVTEQVTTVYQAAAEYADLLETSERVWICQTPTGRYLREAGPCPGPTDRCGWRLLTPEDAK